MSKHNSDYEHIVGHGAGIMTSEITLDHAMMTDSGGATGTYVWTGAIPAYSMPLGLYTETLETYTAAITLKAGASAAQDEYTNGTTATITSAAAKTLTKYESLGGVVTSLATVYITLTHGSDWTLVTAGKVLIRLIYIATRPL